MDAVIPTDADFDTSMDELNCLQSRFFYSMDDKKATDRGIRPKKGGMFLIHGFNFSTI